MPVCHFDASRRGKNAPNRPLDQTSACTVLETEEKCLLFDHGPKLQTELTGKSSPEEMDETTKHTYKCQMCMEQFGDMASVRARGNRVNFMQ